MQRLLLPFVSLFILLIGQTNYSNAQLPNGAIAPDWTLTDLDGNTHNLYSILDEGKTVFLEMSATWCGPCWNFHNSGAFNTLHTQYGPNGTDEARVFFIEADLSTNEACLYGSSGCVGGTQGNWVAGTLFPIINLTATNGPTVRSDYALAYFPTIYVVCPNRTIYEAGQKPAAILAQYINSCSFDVIDIEGDEVTCYDSEDGNVTLEFTGGQAPYSFMWSNGATTQNLENVGQGIYDVTATEKNGIKFYATAEVIGPENPFIVDVVNKSDVNCYGQGDGFLEVAASGGTTGYSYQWSTGDTGSSISGLSGGTYSVTVYDGQNCEEVVVQEIIEPELLESSLDGTPASCDEANGIIEVYTSGGTYPYTYDAGHGPQSSATISGLVEGIYDVTITDANGCMNIETIQIDNFPAPIIDLPLEPQELACDGSNLFIDASNSIYHPDCFFQWTTYGTGNIVSGRYDIIVEVDQPGEYILTISDVDRGCYRSQSVYVLPAPDLPHADAGAQMELTCGQHTVSLDGSQSSQGSEFSYLWTTENGNIVSGETTLSPVVDAVGTYTLEVLDTERSCIASSSTSVVADVNLPVITVEISGKLDCNTSYVNLSGEGSETGENIEVQWTDGEGNIIATDYEITVHLPGTYIFVVENTVSGCVSTMEIDIDENTDLPNIVINAPEILTCVTTEIEISTQGSSAGNKFLYNWTTSDGHIVGSPNVNNPTVDEPGTYTLTVTNMENGCTATETVVVEQDMNLPEADYEEIIDELTVEFENNSSGSPIEYSWDFGDGNSSTEASPTHIYGESNTYKVCLTITNECGSDEFCKFITVSYSEIGVVADVFHVSCAGGANGAIELDVEHGDLTDYTYQWSHGETTSSIDNLEAGTYTVIITGESGVEESRTFTIFEPEAITSDVLVIDVECNGTASGSVTLDVDGGTPPYSYNWSTGAATNEISELVADVYAVTITDANNCAIVVQGIEVHQPDEIAISITEIGDVSCYGGDDGYIEVDVMGGVAPYSLLWNDNNSSDFNDSLKAGYYRLIVSDENSCVMIFDSIEVGQPDNINLIADIKNLSCAGENDGQIIAHIEGGISPYEFEWNTGSREDRVTELEPGEYSLTVTDDNNCEKTFQSITILEPEEIVMDSVIIDEIPGNSAIKVYISGGVLPYKYEWSNGDTSDSIYDLPDGDYLLTITDANGCVVEFGPYTIEATPTGILDVEGIDLFSLYPNPVQDVLFMNVELNDLADMELQLVNNLGQVLYQKKFTGKHFKESVNVSELSPGLYFLRLNTAQGSAIKSVIIGR